MLLSDYIEEIGTERACNLFNVAPTTVQQWKNLQSAPKPETAFEIVKKSFGIVTWEDIYCPIAMERLGFKNKNQLEFKI